MQHQCPDERTQLLSTRVLEGSGATGPTGIVCELWLHKASTVLYKSTEFSALEMYKALDSIKRTRELPGMHKARCITRALSGLASCTKGLE